MKRGGAPLALGAIASQAKALAGVAGGSEPGEVRAFTCSSCGVEPVGPRPGICGGCLTTEAQQRRERELCDRVLIPPRFRWARLDLEPFAPPGITRSIVPPEAVRQVREFRGELLVLRGPSGVGKTALGCARLRAEAERDGRAVFVFCDDLSPDAPSQPRALALLDRAETERAVMLDDVGQDLGGAPAGGGLAAWRGARLKRLVRALHHVQGAGKGKLVILTCALDDEDIGGAGRTPGAYGDDFLRRIKEGGTGALELTLGGAKR